MPIQLYKFHTKQSVWQRFLRCALILPLSLAWTPTALALHRIDPDVCETLPTISEFHQQALTQFELQTQGLALWRNPAQLDALLSQLIAVADDGLDPLDYHFEELAHARAHLATWGQLGRCDIKLATDAYLLALSDLHYGRARMQGTDAVWQAPQFTRPPQPAQLVTIALQGLSDLPLAFSEARPQLPRYLNLRNAYRIARDNLPSQWPEVPPGPTLEESDLSDRVMALRARLEAERYIAMPVTASPTQATDAASPSAASVAAAQRFDPQLTAAVEAFQQRHGLEVDGKVGKGTLAALNVTPAERLEQIKANLERLRWLAQDMGRDANRNLLLVDIAGARLELYEKGQLSWTGRAQVGRPTRETPELKSMITHVTVNPTWNIPRSIFLKDALPSIMRDPLYLSKRNIRVYNSTGDELDPLVVDWQNPKNLSLKQDPGPGNALGEVVIRFSNPFAVYLHDTPSSGLFNTSQRFYSSGCVRVEGAMELTRKLFASGSAEQMAQFEAAKASGLSRNVHLPKGVYVVLAYWTAEANQAGEISFRPDVYHSDGSLLAMLDN